MILSKRDLQWLRCTDILLRLLIMASVISLSSLCRAFISGNVRQYLSQLLLSLPKREVVCLLGLLSPLDLVEFENCLSNVSSSSVELTSGDMNKIWRCVYERCWDHDIVNMATKQPDWRGHFLETTTHWLLNRLTFLHSCTSEHCRGSKFDYVLRALFGCSWPALNEDSLPVIALTSQFCGLHVICNHCKLAIPSYWRDKYEAFISLLEEERLVKLAMLLVDRFNYHPRSIKIISGRTRVSEMYSRLQLNQFFIDGLEAFLCEVEIITCKYVTNVSDPVASKIVQWTCSKQNISKKLKVIIVNSRDNILNIDTWRVALDPSKHHGVDIELELVDS